MGANAMPQITGASRVVHLRLHFYDCPPIDTVFGGPPMNHPVPPLHRKPGDELIYHGTRVDFILRHVTTSTGQRLTREVCLHPGAVIILPVLADGRIVMIANRRHTVDEELLELPAGTLERDAQGNIEDPAPRAAAELLEETGYTAQAIKPFGWFYTSPGILTEKMYAFIATGLTPGPQHLEETEQIKVQILSPSEIHRMIYENQITDAKTIATLLKYFVGENR